MEVRRVETKDRDEFDKLASHPLQSWAWGDFRKNSGLEIIRLGLYQQNKLSETAQLTLHPIPTTKYYVGYLPKGNLPSTKMLKSLYGLGKDYHCIFIKLEPNVKKSSRNPPLTTNNPQLIPSPHPLFTKYTFQIDLTRTEEELLKNMKEKTRYNVRLAQKKGVQIVKDESEEAFTAYWKLMEETTKRQQFFAHNRHYHTLMWQTLKEAGIAHLFVAKFQQKILTAWIVFLFNGILYYPYGASTTENRELMASNLMLWEVAKWGKQNGAKIFDLWGSLGPDPDTKDPWYGFHRFKEGYNPRLVEFIGSYDLVINPPLYRLYNLIYYLRQLFLKIKTRLPF